MKKKKTFQITINKKKFKANFGQTILEAAKANGIEIPTLCFHSDLDIKASCRICVVEIKGEKELLTACSTKAEPGMVINTDSLKVQRARRINLELIFAQHCEECSDCIWNFNCELRNLAEKYKIKTTRFPNRKAGFPHYQFGPAIYFDSSKCINCRNCVEMCEKQGVSFLELEDREGIFEIIPSKNSKRDCTYCGQCIVHCPVGAFEAVGEFEDVEKPLQQKDKIVVFQFAPSIRASIGEEFNMPPGSVVTEKLVAGIKQLGADKVFDTCVGADFTTVEEAKELMEKVSKNCGPCLSSCCPAWVKFIEFYYPEFVPNIATTRSPQILLGSLIKSYWAKKEGINPLNIYVVSVMPCTAKKYEIRRPEVKVGGVLPVDYVLTTRELAYLFKKHKIDLKTIKPQKIDDPLGVYSGSAVIYGASGGVMESALRSAYKSATKKKLPKIEFKQVRGAQGIKRASIKINGKTIRVAVVNGLGNSIEILEELKKNKKCYDAIEVMACPGGCIGGGGQPVPADAEIRKQRAESLYNIDAKSKLRIAQENPIVKKMYEEYFNNKEIIHKVFHTSYSPKSKEVRFALTKKSYPICKERKV